LYLFCFFYFYGHLAKYQQARKKLLTEQNGIVSLEYYDFFTLGINDPEGGKIKLDKM